MRMLYILVGNCRLVIAISFLVLLLVVDMLRTSCFYFFVIVFVILSRTYLCEARHLAPMEKKLHVNRDNLIAKNNEEIKKLEVPSTNNTKTISSEAPIKHAVGDHGEIIDKNTKDDCRVNRASLVKTSVSSKRVSRTWKVPKYSKKLPRSDQEHPGFNLDYMQPTTHPPHHN
ncbi:root meristem growth factor 10-like [Brassica napus]|uniref:root meristem growth factor 10-like n=1 Tax=Brassica napus TaxID=3708 RepID=UPI0020786619|nr:root meristem growth factor 10-like [Brassica napus]